MRGKELAQQGPPLIWRVLGGAGITHAITLAGVATTEARAGVVADLAAGLMAIGMGGGRFPPRFSIEVLVEMAGAPVAGETVELWWAPSKDGLVFPGGVTGVDEDWQAGDEAEFKAQLLHVGSVILSADAHPVAQIGNFVFDPPYRYGCPVLVNTSAQGLQNDDNEHRLTFTPVVREAP